MSNKPNAPEVLGRDFLAIRCMLLELASALDRIARAQGSVADDPRMTKIDQALQVLSDQQPDKASRVQMLFSLPYRESWREDFGLAGPRR